MLTRAPVHVNNIKFQASDAKVGLIPLDASSLGNFWVHGCSPLVPDMSYGQLSDLDWKNERVFDRLLDHELCGYRRVKARMPVRCGSSEGLQDWFMRQTWGPNFEVVLPLVYDGLATTYERSSKKATAEFGTLMGLAALSLWWHGSGRWMKLHVDSIPADHENFPYDWPLYVAAIRVFSDVRPPRTCIQDWSEAFAAHGDRPKNWFARLHCCEFMSVYMDAVFQVTHVCMTACIDIRWVGVVSKLRVCQTRAPVSFSVANHKT